MKAFIFDMDGVLIDSEPLHIEVKLETFRHFGIPFPPEKLPSFAGRTSKDLFTEALLAHPQAGLTWQELASFKHQRYIDRLIHDPSIQPITGVTELLRHLRSKKFRIGLASSSGRNIIEMVLRRFGIRSYFDTIVSGAELPHSKPYPDIYLKAAEGLGIPPCDCTVVEDATAGIAAAKAAGMTCIAFHNPHSGQQDLSQADRIVEHFSEILV